MKYIIDRIEGDFAVVFEFDSGKFFADVKAENLSGMREGDIFTASTDNGILSDIVFLEAESAERRAKIRSRLDKLFGKSKGGDIK